jgi:hypothetical protein
MPEISPPKTSAFALPEHLARKAHPNLIGNDEQQFEAIASSLSESIEELSARLDVTRKQPGAGLEAGSATIGTRFSLPTASKTTLPWMTSPLSSPV